MTRRIFTALTTISFVLLAFASPHSAQDKACPGADQAAYKVVDQAAAESLRNDMLRVYTEAEALVTFLAGYDFIRPSGVMKSHDTLRQELARKRQQLAQLSGDSLLEQAGTWPDKQLLNRLVTLSKSVRTEAKLQAAIEKTGRYLKATGQSLDSLPSKSSTSARATRAVVAAPGYIAPDCDFNDPSNYPSGVDLGIANGVALALHMAVDLTPSEIVAACVTAPSPIRIAFAIASGVTDQVLNALQAIAVNGGTCEKLRLNVEDKLKDDRGITTVLANIDEYLAFMYKSVNATLALAATTTVPKNCAEAQMTLANAFFNTTSGEFTGGTGANRLEAYRLLRNAYQNIGASSCVQ